MGPIVHRACDHIHREQAEGGGWLFHDGQDLRKGGHPAREEAAGHRAGGYEDRELQGAQHRVPGHQEGPHPGSCRLPRAHQVLLCRREEPGQYFASQRKRHGDHDEHQGWAFGCCFEGREQQGGVQVKIENPEKVKANQHVTVLTNGKTAIQKVLDTIKDGISTLQHGKKPEYKDFVTEGLSIVEEADKFVEAARENISNHSIMQNDDSKTEKDWQEFGDKVQPLIDVCSTHVEGLKHYKLRMQALL